MNRKWYTDEKLKEKIENYFCERGIPITFHGENNKGRHVISPKFKNPEIERQKNELIEEGMKGERKRVGGSGEGLSRHFVYDGYGLNYNVEGITDKGFVKENYWESYYKPRSEVEKETKQQDFSQKSDNKESAEKKDKITANQQSSLQNKDNNHQNIYYGVGVISLVLLVISMAVVGMKKKR